ncbi:GDSL esterase/lipase At4g10955 [Linum perenne]
MVGKAAAEQQNDAVQVLEVTPAAAAEAHRYAFHVAGPRNVASLNWRDLVSSSWRDSNYKRTVLACFIQAVYLLELDRQENRTPNNALAPTWWTRFKYRLTRTLIDERDGSIFGAILEWDRSAAVSDMIFVRPSGAPRAVLALRGTLLKGPTMRRDIEDDLRFLAWESLKGSIRFNVAMEALRSVAERYGGSNVCVAGHSLGAGFALQVGKALAKEGKFIEAHLFNPPSVSLAMSFRNIGEKAEFAWKKLRSMLPYAAETPAVEMESTNRMGSKKWVPHLYVNNSDYICCQYTSPEDGGGNNFGQVSAKLFVMSKEKQRFLEAHGLEQWWSADAQGMKPGLPSSSRLMNRQLRSLYNLPAQ